MIRFTTGIILACYVGAHGPPAECPLKRTLRAGRSKDLGGPNEKPRGLPGRGVDWLIQASGPRHPGRAQSRSLRRLVACISRRARVLWFIASIVSSTSSGTTVLINITCLAPRQLKTEFSS